MERDFSQKNILKFLSLGLALIAVILLVVNIFSRSSVVISSFVRKPIPAAKIQWDLLRQPLKISLPEIAVNLKSIPETVTVGEVISLEAVVPTVVKGPFIYKFDCQADGTFDFTTEPTSAKEYITNKMCQYTKAGVYRPKVLLETELTYFDEDGKTKTEKRQAIGEVSLKVNNPTALWSISSCEVDATEGTTQPNFQVTFTVNINNPAEESLSYKWQFGDGVSSTEKIVVHNFQRPGSYFPKVVVSDQKGTEGVCVPSSFQILSELTKFEEVLAPAKIGRRSPFGPYEKEVYTEEITTSTRTLFSTSTRPILETTTTATSTATST